MSKIVEALPASLADPETGMFSEYGRGRWNLIAAVAVLLVAGVVLGAIVGIAAYVF